jgi:hypothetical protein
MASRAYQRGFDVFLGNLRGTNDALGDSAIGTNPADYADGDRAEGGLASPITDFMQSVRAATRPTDPSPSSSPPPSPSTTPVRTNGSPSSEGRTTGKRKTSIAALQSSGLGTAEPNPTASSARQMTADGGLVSPLRGRRARVRSINLNPSKATDPGVAAPVDPDKATVRFIGAWSTGIPVHETLHPRQEQYWDYSGKMTKHVSYVFS